MTEPTQAVALVCCICSANVTLDTGTPVEAYTGDYSQHLACAYCTANATVVCGECNLRVATDTSHSVNDDNLQVCDTCFDNRVYYCEFCGNYYTNDYNRRISDTDTCETCCDTYYSWCDLCDTYFQNDDSHYHDEDDEDESSADGSWEYPYSYGYAPDYRWLHGRGEQHPEWFVGVELEVSHARGRNAGVQCPRWAYFKYDASVSCGAELVTHPFTPTWYEETGANAFRALLNDWEEGGVISGDSVGAGMHVHVGRGAFTDSKHLYRFLRLFYRHQEFTKKISRRTESALDRWAKLTPSLTSLARATVEHKLLRSPRHVAINLSNGNTVEVRFFTGTVKFARFDTNLRIVLAALEFTRTVHKSKDVTTVAFAEWLDQRGALWSATSLVVRRCAELPSRKVCHAG